MSEIRANQIQNPAQDGGPVMVGLTTVSGDLHVTGFGTFLGLTVTGIATYEDVRHVDALGLSTFREGLESNTVSGVSTFYRGTNLAVNTGQVSIGTAVPSGAAELTIRGDNPELALVSNAQFSSFLLMGDTADPDNGMIEYDNTNSDKRMRFIVNANERMRIDNSGNVGVGTVNPNNAVLQVESDTGTARVKFRSGDSNASALYLQNVTTGDGDSDGLKLELGGDEEAYIWMHENADMNFGTNNTSRMVIDKDGIVSVAHTTNVNITGAANGSTTEVLRVDNNNSNSNDNLTTRIAYRRSGNSGTQLYTTLDSVRTGTHDTDFVISNNVGTVLTERLRISAQGTFKFNNGALIEHGDTLTAARNGTQTIDLSSGMVIRCSTASAGTWKPNFRVDSNISLNTAMNDNDIISPTMIVAKGATTHFSNTIQIDGSDVTPEFLGGAPTDGGGSGTFDIYSYTIMKTGDAAFVAFCSVNTYE